jgi:RNA polymerase sigma factor for flagellar operon FliA
MAEAQEKRTGVPDEELPLWEQASSGDSNTARAQLIDRYLPLAKQIAAKLYRNRPDNDVPFDDYFQYASVGLLEAVNRFDETQGAAFATFATHRIRGAVLNGLDNHTERRRQAAFVRHNRRQIVESINAQASEGDDSAFSEVVDLTIMLAIGFLIEDSGSGSIAESRNAPLEAQALDELKQTVRVAVEALPANERIVIRYHYFHQIRFRELAEQLQLSKGRVSQIHKRALERIRSHVSERSSLNDYF